MAKKRLKQKNQKNQRRSQNNFERRIREEHIWDRIFLLNIRKSIWVIILWAVSMIIHNLILQFAKIDEPFFTAIALYIIPLYLLIAVIHTLSKHKRIEGK